MTQRSLNLAQNNNFRNRCLSSGSFRFNQFRCNKEKLTMILAKQHLKAVLRGKLLRVTKSASTKHQSSEHLF